MSLRLREEVQAGLRRGDGELNLLWLPSCLKSVEPSALRRSRDAVFCVGHVRTTFRRQGVD